MSKDEVRMLRNFAAVVMGFLSSEISTEGEELRFVDSDGDFTVTPVSRSVVVRFRFNDVQKAVWDTLPTSYVVSILEPIKLESKGDDHIIVKLTTDVFLGELRRRLHAIHDQVDKLSREILEEIVNEKISAILVAKKIKE